MAVDRAVERYLQSPGGSEESNYFNKQSWIKYLESDAASRAATSIEARIGSKIPIVGIAITAASIGYDIHQGKPAGRAIISGVGGALAAAGTGALIGTAIGGPIGTVAGAGAGAGAGLVVGVVTSGALDWAYDQLPQGAKDAIEGGVSAVGNAVKDVGGAIGSGAKDLWNSIF